MDTRATEMVGIEHPIFAFSHSGKVVAAVSRAGGFGVLGALRFSPDELEAEMAWIDDHVDGKPYGVNVVTPVSYEGAGTLDPSKLLGDLEGMIPDEHRRYVEEVLARHDVPPLPEGAPPPRELLGWTEATARPQLEVAFGHPIKLLTSALGPPPKDVIDEAHRRGIPVGALVGHVDQARAQVEAGVDIVVAQGTEAAGHTGVVASMVLVPDVVDAVAPTPVLAAGGIGSGRQMAAALALGAEGVWTGSIWLTTEENDELPPVVVRKLLNATARDTVRTRAWTGKPARLLRTAWTDAWDDPDSPGTLQMPLQFMLTAEAQHRIFLSEKEALIGMPVGQIVGRMNEVRPAGEVVRAMAAECAEVLDRLDRLAGEREPAP